MSRGAGTPTPGRFLSVALRPVTETIDATRMAAGEPGLPQEFRWRGGTLRVAEVLRTWRETGPCHHGSGEAYARKHWFEVVTGTGSRARLYFERQARGRGKEAARWWLFSLEETG